MDTSFDAATEALDQASQRDPRVSKFGYYAYDDCNLASVGLFFWFDSAHDLLNAIVHFEPHIYGGEPELKQRLNDVIGEPAKCELSSALLDRVNAAAKGDFQIAWWGTLNGLRSDELEWARDFRGQFRELELEDPDEDPSTEAILDEEVEDFVGFLREYGH